MREHLWTVARFPCGAWTTGGKPTDPEYAYSEVFQVLATSIERAKLIAQGVRRRKSYTPRLGKDWGRANLTTSPKTIISREVSSTDAVSALPRRRGDGREDGGL